MFVATVASKRRPSRMQMSLSPGISSDGVLVWSTSVTDCMNVGL